jgi:hypothetical protein
MVFRKKRNGYQKLLAGEYMEAQAGPKVAVNQQQKPDRFKSSSIYLISHNMPDCGRKNKNRNDKAPYRPTSRHI